eukprot:UN28988
MTRAVVRHRTQVVQPRGSGGNTLQDVADTYLQNWFDQICRVVAKVLTLERLLSLSCIPKKLVVKLTHEFRKVSTNFRDYPWNEDEEEGFLSGDVMKNIFLSDKKKDISLILRVLAELKKLNPEIFPVNSFGELDNYISKVQRVQQVLRRYSGLLRRIHVSTKIT